MPPGATSDQVTAIAQPGAWTHLVATHEPVTGRMSLFVNGALAGSVAHTKRVPSGTSVTVGAAYQGGIDDLQLFPYALTSGEITKLRAGQTMRPAVPTGTVIIPATNTGNPGCHQNGGYGTVSSSTPRLSATVSDDDPTVPVRGGVLHLGQHRLEPAAAPLPGRTGLGQQLRHRLGHRLGAATQPDRRPLIRLVLRFLRRYKRLRHSSGLPFRGRRLLTDVPRPGHRPGRGTSPIHRLIRDNPRVR